jgi:hypothetical protein
VRSKLRDRRPGLLPGLLALIPLISPAFAADTVRSGPGDAGAVPAEIAFRDFYRMPVGPRGLEPTEKLLGLDGRRVRIEGYVVQEEDSLPGLFLMTPTPVALAERADGPADYLPGAAVFVDLRADHAGQKYLAYRPGLWTVVGTLELGGREEPDGRYSYVRLVVDDLSAVRDSTGQVALLSADAPAGHRHGH